MGDPESRRAAASAARPLTVEFSRRFPPSHSSLPFPPSARSVPFSPSAEKVRYNCGLNRLHFLPKTLFQLGFHCDFTSLRSHRRDAMRRTPVPQSQLLDGGRPYEGINPEMSSRVTNKRRQAPSFLPSLPHSSLPPFLHRETM